jgi:hypothetical protein
MRALSFIRRASQRTLSGSVILSILIAGCAGTDLDEDSESQAEGSRSAVEGITGHVFAIASVGEDGATTTTMMFAPDGKGVEGWQPLTGESAAGLQNGRYHIVGQDTGEQGIVVDSAEPVEGGEELAAAAALGVLDPVAFHIYFDLDIDDTVTLHQRVSGPVLAHMTDLSNGARNANFEERVTNLPSSLVVAARNDPCNSRSSCSR